MIMKKITDRQSDYLNFINKYITDNERPPTIRDMCTYFMCTTRAVVCHLNALEQKGYIKIERNTSRGIRVIK